MRKILLPIACLTVAATAVADSDLPNPGFKKWVNCVPWTSTGNTTPLGGQPEDWTISNVIGINGLGKTEVGQQAPGPFGSVAVKVANTPNSLLATQTVPGYFTLGTTWSTSVMGNENDGGTFGGYAFTTRPDAIHFAYKTEGDISADTPATFVAYLWKGTFTQADVPANIGMTAAALKTVSMVNRDRNILGMETAKGGEVTRTDGAALIAKAVESISTASSDFIEAKIELTYLNDETPEMINIIFAANDYFADASTIKQGNAITIANLKTVYYSTLESLTIGGTPLAGFDPSVYDYTVAELPELSAINAVAKGKSAKVSIAQNGNTITITVNNPDGADDDGESTHTYTLTAEEVGDLPDAKQYSGKLVVELAGSPITADGGEDATITITPTGKNTVSFLLPNLSLGDLGTLGDIKLDNVATSVNGTVTTYTCSVTDFPVMGGAIIADSVKLNGTTDSETNEADMTIEVMWMDMPIICTFKGKDTAAGISAVADDNAPVEYYNLNGVRLSGDNLPAGIYVRRQGNAVSKIIIR